MTHHSHFGSKSLGLYYNGQGLTLSLFKSCKYVYMKINIDIGISKKAIFYAKYS